MERPGSPDAAASIVEQAIRLAVEQALAGAALERCTVQLLEHLSAATDRERRVALPLALAAFDRVRTERRRRWLAYLAHELRNPLHSLGSALWLLLENPPAGSEHVLDLAERTLRRMEPVVDELQHLDRHVESGEPPRARTAIDATGPA
jgi:signal transduction histidine kinase